ncbi:aryl-alcohol dehydrogenase-like predicted oxidoreductase [Rhodococcus sp. 27YEA15]|uniref:aldo/keto reductase n=1 Tax=Rhodococcus sp. 27YEA15 TaxID=3156259 RepID=UPI003C79C6A2
MDNMPQAILGQTGLSVSKIGFGAMELRGPYGDWPTRVDDETASTLLHSVLDLGINLIDTAPDYGLSEQLIGEFLAHRRDEYYLATKCGCAVRENGEPFESNLHTFERPNIRAAVEQSLRRMKTDYIDIIQFHHSPTRSELVEQDSIAELLELREAGMVRFIGMSATLPNCYEHLEMNVFDVIQVPYSLVERDHEDFLSQASAAGVGTIARNGVARGIVSASKDKVDAIPDGWREQWLTNRDRFESAGLGDLLDGASRTEFMIRYLLATGSVDSTILGTGSPAHLADNVSAAVKGPLDSDVYDEARRRIDVAAVSSS